MAMHTDLPIHKVAFDLLSLATDVTRNIPRDFKAGLGAKVRDEYIEAKTKSAGDGSWDSDSTADYDEQTDEYFWPAGWYEVVDNWDELTHIAIHEGEVTQWTQLPAAPDMK